MTDELTDYATQWLADRTGDKPFLLYRSHKGVHGLYDPAPRHRDRYKDAKFTPPPTMAITPGNDLGNANTLDSMKARLGKESPPE